MMARKEAIGLSFNTSDTQSLNEIKKVHKMWLAQAIVGAICSDGRVDQEELTFLKTAIGFLDTQEEVMLIMNMAKAREVPKLSSLRDIPRGHSIRFIMMLAKITIADGRISKGEVDYLREVSRKLGFDKYFYDQLIKFCKNQILVNEQVDALKRYGLNSNPEYDV